MIVDTVRPVSVRRAGAATAVPSGTLASVTSDDSDSTYAQTANTLSTGTYSLRVQSHTPAAGYQRHKIRGRSRSRVDAGTGSDFIELGYGDRDYNSVTQPFLTSTFAEYSTDWVSGGVGIYGFGLDTVGALSTINIGGGQLLNVEGGATTIQVAEHYVDFDCRFHPDFSPQVQDSAGNDFSGGTITTTTQPKLFFGAVGYDDLPALDWSVTVTTGATEVFAASGSGVPPTVIPVTTDLADAVYTATFTARSTIRIADPFPRTIVIGFTIANIVPPPSPPLVTVTAQDGGYLVEWAFAGGQPWDDGYVVAEVLRDDCTGSQRIAVLADGLTGSYLDLAVPQLDPQPTGQDCTLEATACDITYRVRYWGYVSTTVEVPDTIPDGLVLAWPGTAASIPSGWARVTDLDTRYPRGATGTGAPTATGGAASHSHSAPAHTHTFYAHTHSVGGSTSISGVSYNVTQEDTGGYVHSPAIHSHPMPGDTGLALGRDSGSATPGTSSVNNTPPTREVIWVQSAGGQTSFPAGILGFSLENISGWTTDAASSGRYLRGAPAAGNGGATYGAASHNHTINSHAHTGFNHTHGINDTGLSTPVQSTRGIPGDSSDYWKPRHTHPVTAASAGTGSTNSGSGGTTGTTAAEPPHRRLRVLRNVNGGIQTRIIGLYTGDIASLNATLTLCNGSNGTPDMRTWFVREASPNSANTTGGATSHTHTTPNHGHTVPGHTHGLTISTSRTTSQQANSAGFDFPAPRDTHTHLADNTDSTAVPVASSGAGATTSVSHLPTYREVHFVRLDAIVAGGPLDAPELKISEYASVTVPAFTYGDGLDRLATFTTTIAIATDRSHDLPRIVADSTPLAGGLHTVSTTEPGEVMSLTIGVEGKPDIDELETVLAADRVYFSPVGGEPGWYAPSGWAVANPTPGVWLVSVQMTRQPWPSVAEPEDFL